MNNKHKIFMELVLMKIQKIHEEAIFKNLALDEFTEMLREFIVDVNNEVSSLYEEGYQLYKDFE